MSVYRPQFPYITPPDCQDQRCVYSFDKTNTPQLTGGLQAGLQISRIPLVLDKDADFYLRAISTTDTNNITGQLQFRLEDPKGHPLSDTDNSLMDTNFQFPPLYSATDGAGIVALDSDNWGVYCQAGSRLYLFLWNNGSLGSLDLTLFVLNLHGIKRYSGDQCR